MHYTERLLAHVKSAEQATQAAKEQVLRQHGITAAQQSALAVLSDNEAITAAELSRRCSVTPQTMNGTLGRLETRGLIERRAHPVHGTLIEVRLTDEGRTLFTAADADVAKLDQALGRELASDELDELRDLLNRVTATARELSAQTQH